MTALKTVNVLMFAILDKVYLLLFNS